MRPRYGVGVRRTRLWGCRRYDVLKDERFLGLEFGTVGEVVGYMLSLVRMDRALDEITGS
jgi:hypothetical protein